MTEPLDVARDMVGAWNRMDWDRVVALFAEDGVLHSVMQDPIVGRPAIETRIRSLTAGLERIELRVKAMGVIDGRVFIERVDDFDINGRHVELPVVGILRIGDDGLVTEWLEYYDRATMMRGMGLPADFSHS
ncbi:nuclear transport factor 2 family protein [Dactylosporangium sp. CS-033363]|uniref:nuclear transport factor 2 family protein n=1 Tax=Dactylosporangium sp. CS-033363 TaxID=3239935 RepID=UPI003D8E25FA